MAPPFATVHIERPTLPNHTPASAPACTTLPFRMFKSRSIALPSPPPDSTTPL